MKELKVPQEDLYVAIIAYFIYLNKEDYNTKASYLKLASAVSDLLGIPRASFLEKYTKTFNRSTRLRKHRSDLVIGNIFSSILSNPEIVNALFRINEINLLTLLIKLKEDNLNTIRLVHATDALSLRYVKYANIRLHSINVGLIISRILEYADIDPISWVDVNREKLSLLGIPILAMEDAYNVLDGNFDEYTKAQQTIIKRMLSNLNNIDVKSLDKLPIAAYTILSDEVIEVIKELQENILDYK